MALLVLIQHAGFVPSLSAAIDPDSRRYVPCSLLVASSSAAAGPVLHEGIIRTKHTHEDATQLVQHPVGWGIEPLHVLLWPAHLRKTNHSMLTSASAHSPAAKNALLLQSS